MSKNLINSNKLQNRASKVIPHLTGTFSRNAHSFVEGVFPVYVKSANGSHFIDVDGNDYLDYLCGIGPITLGYNYKAINDAIIQQLKDGILFCFNMVSAISAYMAPENSAILIQFFDNSEANFQV